MGETIKFYWWVHDGTRAVRSVPGQLEQGCLKPCVYYVVCSAENIVEALHSEKSVVLEVHCTVFDIFLIRVGAERYAKNYTENIF